MAEDQERGLSAAMNSTPGTGALSLADYPLAKIRVACTRCERTARYDRTEMVRRVGADTSLPTLRLEMAEELGCKLAAQNKDGNFTVGMEQCGMRYPDPFARYQSGKGGLREEGSSSFQLGWQKVC